MKYHSVLLLSSVLFLANACTSAPVSPGQEMVSLADNSNHLGKKWNKGNKISHKGNKTISEGEDMIKKGEAMIRKGESLVSNGHEKIQKGQKMLNKGNAQMQESEVSYLNLLGLTAKS